MSQRMTPRPTVLRRDDAEADDVEKDADDEHGGLRFERERSRLPPPPRRSG
jgi:hypothetical protein